MTKKEKLGWGVCGSLGVAVLSFFMNYIAVYEFDTAETLSGFKMLEATLDYFEYMNDNFVLLIVAAIATFAALIIAFMGNRKGNIGLLPAVLSVVSVICMFILFNENNMMEVAGSGFWVFMLAHAACVVLSFMAKNTND